MNGTEWQVERVEKRFEERVTRKPDGCWVFAGRANPSGYVHHNVGQRKILAHRWAYEHFVGPIPSGLVLDHLCRNKVCVNPAHLEPVTQRENLLRGRTVNATNATKTHCPKRHPYTPESVYVSSQGKRRCRECHRLAMAKYRASQEHTA